MNVNYISSMYDVILDQGGYRVRTWAQIKERLRAYGGAWVIMAE